ncbi:MAG: right-handed parallel beta-helix repeat-containing protein [Ancrocorticia sp.]
MIAASIVLPTLIVPSSAMAEEAPRTSVTVADDIPLAADTMNRTVTEGWGSADTGGSYTASPEKAGAVKDGTATLVSPAPGQTASMTLDSVVTRDVLSHVDVALPHLPVEGSEAYVSSFARGDAENSYAVVLIVDSDGTSELVLERKQKSVDDANESGGDDAESTDDNGESADGDRNFLETTFVTVPGPQVKAGEPVSVEFSVVGTDTVELGAKAWTVGTEAPESWMAFAQDTESDHLTEAGAVGVSVSSPRDGEVSPIEFDNLLIEEIPASPTDSQEPSLESAVTVENEAETEVESLEVLDSVPSMISDSPSVDALEAEPSVDVLGMEPLTAQSSRSSSAAVAPMAAAQAAKNVLAADTMNRSVSEGWGSATTGGKYTSSAKKIGSVSGGRAILVSPAPGRTATMTLDDVKAQDVVSSIDVSLPTLPASGSKVYITHFARGTNGTSYGVMLMVESTGKSYVILQRKNDSDETKFKTAAGPQLKAGQAVTLELSIEGTKSVKLGAKAWKAGTKAPTAMMVAATDTAADRITKAGPVGVSVYASASGKVTPVTFDNLATNSIQATPTPKPTPTPTPKPTPTPSPSVKVPGGGTISTPNYTGRRLQSGSAQLSSLNYPIPSSAVYVAPNGSDSNKGTKASPFKTISAATKAAKANGTVVVRGGVYHESVLVYPHDGLTVQAYPKETVWLDGSEQVTGWSKSGNVWVKSNWTTFFDNSPTYKKGAPDSTVESWQWVNPSYPMASYPDQIWVDNIPLKQVGSRSAVTAGTFYVDRSAKQLVMGTDPTNKRVDVSTLSEAMSVRATNSVIRGIGVRRYATSVPQMGAVSTYFNGVTLENMMIVDNATTGLFVGAKNVTVRNVTLRNNGLLGMGANNADNLKVESLFSEKNNSQRFNRAPVSGAMKITRSRQISVTGSSFINNYGQGPWFDESVYNITFADNDSVNNEGNGVVFELSDTVKAVNNLIMDNSLKGMLVSCTGNVEIWNNTFVGNNGSLDVVQDERRASNLSAAGHDKRQPLPDPTMPWITKNVTLVNNVFSQSKGEAVIRVNDWSKEFKSTDLLSKSEGNLFHTASSSLPIATWYPDAKKWTVYKTFAAYQSATGRDSSSTAVVGTSPLTVQFNLTSSYKSRASKALPITTTIANSSSGL